MDDHGWDGLLIATAIVAGSLLVATGVGMTQARAMTRLRRRALRDRRDAELQRRARRGARLAGALRGAIALFTLALVVLGSALAR